MEMSQSLTDRFRLIAAKLHLFRRNGSFANYIPSGGDFSFGSPASSPLGMQAFLGLLLYYVRRGGKEDMNKNGVMYLRHWEVSARRE